VDGNEIPISCREVAVDGILVCTKHSTPSATGPYDKVKQFWLDDEIHWQIHTWRPEQLPSEKKHTVCY